MKSDLSGLNQFRVRSGEVASTDEDGANGAFICRTNDGTHLQIICAVNDPPGWAHIAVGAFEKPKSSIVSRITLSVSEKP